MSDTEELPPAKKPRPGPDNNAFAEDNQDFTEDLNTTTNEFVVDDKYNNYVTPEELQKLKEFKILDEVKSDDEEGDSDDAESDCSQEIPEVEIEKMLDEDLPEDFKGTPKPKEKPYVLRSKTIMEEKGVNPFEVLPLDWICARHMSGIPVYMHRPTRVVTLAKPYCLGKSNIQRHDIPISAIPCLAYRRGLEEEEKQKKIDKKIQEQIDIVNAQTQGETSIANLVKNQTAKSINKTVDQIITEAMNSKDKDKTGIAVCPFKEMSSDTEAQPKNVIENADNSKQETLENFNEDITKKGNEGTTSIAAVCDKVNSLTDIKECIEQSGKPNEAETNEDRKGGTETENTDEMKNIRPFILPGGKAVPPPRVENVNTSWKTQHLTAEQINDYCKKLFQFKTVEIMHFKSWADRRKYTKARKALQYPTLPEGTKLITIPNNGQENGGKGKRDWVMNMNGRCYLSVFHEYVYRALHKQPVYEFTQLENAATPYQATVYIGEMQYGVGFGSSKRQAKAAAARASIQILIPEMNEELAAPNSNEPDFSFFDYVGIEDPRIAEFCAATCEPSPHAILRTCLLRNFGANDRHINVTVKKIEYQKIQLTMKVGKHSASVVCQNKKAAKQRASQAILQSLHPHIRSWGSLLRLYGSRSIKSCKEKKLEEQQITLLQDQARRNEPNRAVLDKLKHEMLKLRERDEAVVPIGTLMLTEDLPTHSGSNLNNVDL
ncbi:unnamed protein product [Leptosia nina]|uniref:DRBM domain-containing protein n=1 Tax=Leptosia nina TaxID=320188 RepID=A0AAV1IW61_9NEOP